MIFLFHGFRDHVSDLEFGIQLILRKLYHCKHGFINELSLEVVNLIKLHGES